MHKYNSQKDIRAKLKAVKNEIYLIIFPWNKQFLAEILMTVHDFREIIQHQAFPELVKHGEDSHGGVKYDSSNGQNVSSEEYTLVGNLLDALMKNKNVTKHTLSRCLFFQWTQIQCIRRSQYHQPGH